ncbi:MAG: type II secretion system protein GspD [Gemmatimonadales bacterium]
MMRRSGSRWTWLCPGGSSHHDEDDTVVDSSLFARHMAGGLSRRVVDRASPGRRSTRCRRIYAGGAAGAGPLGLAAGLTTGAESVPDIATPFADAVRRVATRRQRPGSSPAATRCIGDRLGPRPVRHHHRTSNAGRIATHAGGRRLRGLPRGSDPCRKCGVGRWGQHVTAEPARVARGHAMSPRGLVLASALFAVCAGRGMGQDSASVRVARDSVRVRFLDADLRAVLQSLGALLDRPVLLAEIPQNRVTFETPRPIPRQGVLPILRGLVDVHGLRLVEDSAFYRIGPRVAEPPWQATTEPAQGQSQPSLFVIRLHHARAADVAATINLLFGTGSGFEARPGLSTGTLSDELRRSGLPPAAPPAPDSRGGTAATISGPLTLVPDEVTNSLLLRSSRVDFEVIEQAVRQLDIRPLQVLIEVLIVEARKDRSFSLGASVDYSRRDGANEYNAGFGSAGAGDVVIQFMRMARSDVTAILSAAQSRGDVEIVSRPVLLASNNTEASFLVGSQRPFVQVSRSLPTDLPSRDQVIQYRDVGTKLLVRPTINQDGYVSLLIQQEISGATDETQFGAPIISTREARTELLVKDGQTIVLGGLTDLQRERFQTGVPVLSGIPIVGGLFGSARRRSTATELFLFLTPRIIRTDADVDSVTAPRLPPEPERPKRPTP